ncbi:MAG: NAD-dependent dihydropyrimidine dehydrogenase subunit PreA [bacterium]
MANLSIDFCGIKSPNPFWLASAPPTNSGYQVNRAFEAGWGGAVWKTIGDPVMNTVNRYGGLDVQNRKLIGLNNIELISDRDIEINLKEMTETKRNWPDRAVIASLMVESKPEAWHDIVRRVEDTGCDGLELNFGCPHGMSERGMGSAVGQVPEYCQSITEWVKEVSTVPVIVKLTPNVNDIVPPGRAAVAGGADALSLINTINSIIGVDLDTFEMIPSVRGKGTHGGFAGPAVKPIALHMVSALGRDSEIHVPLSGIGGIENWRDVAEFMLLGCTSVQVCTAVMHYGFRIVEDMSDGLSNWLDEKGFKSVTEIIGKSLEKVTKFEELDLLYRSVSRIDKEKCISCNLCYIACLDASHQCIELKPYNGSTKPEVVEQACVGCRLCAMICPVEDCIRMVEMDGDETISWKQLSSKLPQPLSWEQLRIFQKEHGIEVHHQKA